MGRSILQKKKNRSSLNKVRRKPKSKKLKFGDKLLASKWDKKLTLSQNYRKLGLATDLNRPTGGVEKTIAILREQDNEDASKTIVDRLAINSALPSALAAQEARVERDPNTGEILRIIEDPGSARANPLGDLLNDIEESEDNGSTEDARRTRRPRTEVVKELESIAASGGRPKRQHQSRGEIEWIEALVARYGDDYDKMFRDRKLNPMQQSAGQIRKKVLLWRKLNAP